MRWMAFVTAVVTCIGAPAWAAETSPLLRQSVWKKFCGNEPGGSGHVCATRADVFDPEDDSFRATIEIVDRDGRRTLRVTFPLGVQLVHGTRLMFYGSDPWRSPYTVCFAYGCISEYEMTSALSDGLATRQALIVQSIDKSGNPRTITASIAGLQEALDAPKAEPFVEDARPPRKPWLDDTLRPELRPARN